MKRFPLFIMFLLAFLFIASHTLTAQEQAMKIGLVDSKRAIGAHPSGAQANAIEQQAQQEIGQLRADLDAIASKYQPGQTPTDEDRAFADNILRSIESAQERYRQQIEATAAPAIEAVNNAITAVAQEQGYAMVLDKAISAQSNLVVYARDELDITDLVIQRIQ